MVGLGGHRMTRMLSALVLLVASLSTFSVAPPANAATVSVTIHASKTTLLEGSSTVISGNAVNAEPGSFVRLEHRSNGSWVTVKSTKTAADRTYAFMITPKRGWQFYRVVKPRQLGQPTAASPRLTLAVQWTPSITFATETKIVDGAQWAIIRGSVADQPDALSASYLHVQERQSDGTWRVEDTNFSWNDPLRTEFMGTAEFADGAVYRLALDATALTRAVRSQPATFSHQRYTMSVNSGLHLTRLDDGLGAATVELDLDGGRDVTLAGSGTSWVLHLLDPAGSEVGQVSSTQKFGRFPAVSSGTYQIVVDNFDSATGNAMDVWASTPLIQDVEVGTEPPPTNLLPRQELDLRFAVPADHAVTVNRHSYYEWTSDDDVVDDAGNAVAALIPARHAGSQALSRSPVFYSPTDAILRYRYRPDSAAAAAPSQPTVFEAPIQDIDVDGPASPSGPVPEGAVALFRYQPPVGWRPTLSTDIRPLEGHGPLAPWNGAYAILTGAHANSGSMQLLSPLEFDVALDDPELTVDTTQWFARELILHVALEAGDVVSGTGTVWPEYAGTLRGPSGELIPRAGNFGSAFIAPVDGEYTYHVVSEHQVEKIGVALATELIFPTDAPTRFAIETPDHVAYAWCSAPPGTTVSIDALAADTSLGDIWTVGISDPPDGIAHVNSEQPSTTFTVGPSGRYLVLFDVTADRTGAVTLQQHVVSAP